MPPDNRLRRWLLALDRYELRLRGNAGRARNAMILHAALYGRGIELPGFLFASHEKRLTTVLADQYGHVVPHFADNALAGVKSRPLERKAADDLFVRLTLQWANREALRRAKMIAATDRGDVIEAITNGLEEGLGVAEVARNIRKVTQLTPARAATVARTETHQAATFAATEAARAAETEYGVTLVKVWLPTLDGRTRPEHGAMQGIPLTEKFVVGGELMDRPGDASASPENTINCAVPWRSKKWDLDAASGHPCPSRRGLSLRSVPP